MTGEVLRIGPFVGGLNLASDESSVADEELVVCENFELDIDGSLRSRPPYVRHTNTGPEGHKIIGSAVFDGVGYIFSSGTDTGGTQRISYSTDGITWNTISLRLALTCIQYRGSVWFPAAHNSAGASVRWNPTDGAVTVTAMPSASHAVVHKERLYLVPGITATDNTSRLRFSAPADLTDWPGVNFIDVSPGDGETLNAVIVYNDNLLLFKDNSVFVLAYDLNPSDAILREINPVLGTQDGDSIVQFENVVYALHDDIVYEIVNYDFSPINVKVPFVKDTTTPIGQTRIVDTCLSLIGERLVVKFWAKTYVYDLRVQTWSEWKVNHQPEEQWHEQTKFFRMPNTSDYYSRRAYSVCTCVFRVPDKPNSSDKELSGFSGLKLKGVIGDYLSTPDTAALHVTGDLDLRAKIALDDWTPSSTTWVISKAISTGLSRAYALLVNTSGTLAIQWYPDGINLINKPSTVPTGFADGSTHWIRVTLTVNNGSGGNDVKFWTSDDGVIWTQLGTTVTTAGITSVFPGTNDLELGARNQGTTDRMSGGYFEAQVRNGIDGTLVARPILTAIPNDTTSFVDGTGLTWTLNGSAFLGSEKFVCTLRTKDFDMADPVHYKRLFWWSADVLTGDRIIGKAHPISYSFAPNWEAMTMAWEDVPGTWNQPLLAPASVITTIPADNNFVLQKTAKFDRAIRFRKIAFEVLIDTSGGLSEEAKLFSLTATVLTKQKITQRVS